VSHGDGTRSVRAGLPGAKQGAPFLPGPVLAAPFHLQGEVADSEFSYNRYGNPTWSRYEAALAELEEAEVVLFASGMAAATALLVTLLQPGDALAIDQDCYHGVRHVAKDYLGRYGVDLRQAAPADLAGAADGARVLWMESPSNPKLDVYDLGALARGTDAVVVVDNTTAGPLYQRPLDLGADYALTSATKHLSGHGDLMVGYVATRDAERAQALRDWRTETGAIAGPFETWIAHRSLATYALRLERGSANALALAELLAARDDVTGVRYPGLPSDPGHELARRQMRGFGTVLAFDVGSRERAGRFFAASELIVEATSFGGVITTAERRARWGGDDVGEGFIRLSAGCEDAADLLADLEQALAAA
jgi:cystathionine gamma-lyase